MRAAYTCRRSAPILSGCAIRSAGENSLCDGSGARWMVDADTGLISFAVHGEVAGRPIVRLDAHADHKWISGVGLNVRYCRGRAANAGLVYRAHGSGCRIAIVDRGIYSHHILTKDIL